MDTEALTHRVILDYADGSRETLWLPGDASLRDLGGCWFQLVGARAQELRYREIYGLGRRPVQMPILHLMEPA